jgi:hypothetical protein
MGNEELGGATVEMVSTCIEVVNNIQEENCILTQSSNETVISFNLKLDL